MNRRSITHGWLLPAIGLIKEVLHFPVDFKRRALADFSAEFPKVAHDPLKFRGQSGKVIDQGTEIDLFIRVQPVTDNPQSVFEWFEVFLHV
jgi:hypothetical protein